MAGETGGELDGEGGLRVSLCGRRCVHCAQLATPAGLARADSEAETTDARLAFGHSFVPFPPLNWSASAAPARLGWLAGPFLSSASALPSLPSATAIERTYSTDSAVPSDA